MNREQIITEVKRVVELANKKYKTKIDVPEVEFFNKGRRAGYAIPGLNKLGFNVVLAKENAAIFHETVIHEVAHIVVTKVYPWAKQAHGPEFKAVDVSLGGRGTRCHSYDVSSVKVKKTITRYECKCGCKEPHYVTKKVAARAWGYRCKVCNENLSYTGKARKITK